jgi:uncharacterized protein YodC (DUF2158 family)
MSDTSIQVGDVVRLKSGGPLMTVYKCGNNDIVICTWFPSVDKAVTAGFLLMTLKKENPS